MKRPMRLHNLIFSFLVASLLTLTAVAQRAANPPQQPDPTLTPGDVLEVGVKDICVVGYTQKVRNVPESVKRKVYTLYGIRSHQPGEYEVDHLISLELGGSNAIGNLWPESYLTSPYNAHTKDVLENKLHRLVCSGQLDLRTAQRVIATDWVGAYHRYVLQDTQGPLASNQRPSRGRTASNAPPYNRAPRQPDYGDTNAPPPYSRNPRKPVGRRTDQRDTAEVEQEQQPVYRIPVQSRRKPSKRCKWKNIWCGFGLLK